MIRSMIRKSLGKYLHSAVVTYTVTIFTKFSAKLISPENIGKFSILIPKMNAPCVCAKYKIIIMKYDIGGGDTIFVR